MDERPRRGSRYRGVVFYWAFRGTPERRVHEVRTVHAFFRTSASTLDISYFDGGARQSISVRQEGDDAMISYGGDLIASGAVNPLSMWDSVNWTPLTWTSGGTLNDVALDFAVFE